MTSPLETRLALSSWAKSEAVKGISEVPMGSNDGPPFELYSMPGEQPLSWCARFVRTGLLLFDALAKASLGMRYDMASASMMYKHLLVLGASPVDASDVHEGDLRFLVGRGGSDPLASEEAGGIHHVGIVVDDPTVRNGERVCGFVDGNWGDMLSMHTDKFDQLEALYLRFPCL